MDFDASILYHQLEDMEDDEIDDGPAVAIMALGAIEVHRLRTERRKPSRLYLCRPQLAHNPRGSTAWQIKRRKDGLVKLLMFHFLCYRDRFDPNGGTIEQLMSKEIDITS
ncbi:hypothetical protein DFH06DRAFT_1359673 [Mycena polygramma]|nr:hypothetical protein DFH06DRAFT_1359673 [Mycena polygramma]